MSFIDTNVLVYAAVAGSPYNARAVRALTEHAGVLPTAISRQIMREYLADMTRPQAWAKALSVADAVADIVAFSSGLRVLEDGPFVWERLRSLSQEFVFSGRQVHDANIVATMLAHGESSVITFNAADFHRFGRVVDIIIP